LVKLLLPRPQAKEKTLAEGALFYGETRRRFTVAFDGELRRLAQEHGRH